MKASYDMRLKLGDVDATNDVASVLAAALVSTPMEQGLVVKQIDVGHVNIIAQRRGVLELDVERITALNMIAPHVTVSTLPLLRRVASGTVVASIKVLSPTVEADLAERIVALAEHNKLVAAMGVRIAERTTATLIETHYPGGRIAPSGRRMLEERLDRIGATLERVNDIPHVQDPVAQAIKDVKSEIVILLTVAATTSLTDVAPSALRQAGGVVERWGMPVHPGYGMMIGWFDEKPVLHLPSSARSLALNGVDWVLERLVCGIPICGEDIAAMAIGGLMNDGFERGFRTA